MNGAELKRMMNTHEMLSRAYADDRLAGRAGVCAIRPFITAAVWVFGWERPREGGWSRVAHLTGIRPESLWLVFSEDRPRYEPPPDHRTAHLRCGAPGVRKPACGRRTRVTFRITDPADGTWRMAGFCERHDDEGRVVFEAEQARRKAGNLPEPPPNTGGLLPCYLRWDWAAIYARANSSWRPPAAGVCADAWAPPAPGAQQGGARLTLTRAPRLTVIHGDGDRAGLPAPPPGLTLVREEE